MFVTSRNMIPLIQHFVLFVVYQVLWPYLLEFLVPDQYFDAVGAVCRCVASIGQKKREEKADDYLVNFSEEGELECFLNQICVKPP